MMTPSDTTARTAAAAAGQAGSSARIRPMATDLLRHLRRRWWVYLPILAIWGLAYTRVFIDPTPRLPLLFNWTGSLPYRVAWLQREARPLQRGDLVVFAFAGEARNAYPGLDRQPFFKIVRGLPGDMVTVSGRSVAVNGVAVGTAKTHAFDRRPLEAIAPTVIPPGHYYMQGTGADSFDSRYRSSGLVRADQILGTVVPLF
jgi:conjugal transfer pilin signal peptidase TrbI